MYYCNECERTFERPHILKERNEHFGNVYYDEYEVCPHCHSDNFDSAFQCVVCDEYKPASAQGAYANVCKSCETATAKKLDRFCVSLTSGEKDLLNAMAAEDYEIFN